MQLEKPDQDQKVEIDMTPMIDVVFLLIIFFMVVSEITKMQTQQGIILPLASDSKPNEDPSRLVINVDSEGNVWEYNKILTPRQVNATLKREFEMNNDGKFCDRAVLVRADKNVEYRHIAAIMLMCQQNKVWKLSFGSKPFEVGN